MTSPTYAKPQTRATSSRQGLAARLVLRRLDAMQQSGLRIHMGPDIQRCGDAHAPLQADVVVHDDAAFRLIATRGVLGAGEAYAAGYWTSPDLASVVRVLVRNRPLLAKLDSGMSRLARPFLALLYRMQANTRKGSRRNIAAHYDLGNDFFRLFLDETMTYSCGIFRDRRSTMADASRAKYERICQELRLTADDHVLEVGCGWGGFAIYAAKNFGCRVTATTISAEQYAYAREQVREAGLQDRVKIISKDYRDLVGSFEHVVSIEMIEAVGHKFLSSYLRVLSDRVRPGGTVALQAITIADNAYEQARRNVDFIKRHIFPGSFIPSVTAILQTATKHTPLRLVALHDIGLHYAETLRRWREALSAHNSAARELGYDETFLRAWDYYFAYCEGGFAEGFLSTVQLTFARPAHGAVAHA